MPEHNESTPKRIRFAFPEHLVAQRQERLVPVPRWLRSVCSSAELTFETAVEGGAQKFVASAIWHGGGARRASRNALADVPLQMREHNLSHLLCDLPLRLGVPYQMGRANWRLFAATVAKKCAQFIPESSRRQRVTAGWLHGALANSTNTKILRSGGARCFRPETPFSLMQSAFETLRRMRRAPRAKKTSTTDDPADGRVEHLPLRPTELLALAMFELACRFLPEMFPCRHCFRWSRPGYDFCVEHGQSVERSWEPMTAGAPLPQFSNDEKRGAARRYAHAAAVSVEFGYLCWNRGAMPRPMGFAALPRLFSSVVWHSPMQRADRVDAAIRNQLGRSPRALAHIGADAGQLNPARLTTRLRDRLDQYEYDDRSWVTKLRYAELWFDSEARLAERAAAKYKNRRPRADFVARIAEAEILAKIGCSQAEIARRLLVSRSTVSKWVALAASPGLTRALKRNGERFTHPINAPKVYASGDPVLTVDQNDAVADP